MVHAPSVWSSRYEVRTAFGDGTGGKAGPSTALALLRSGRDDNICSRGEEHDAARHQECSHPATVVDPFVQEQLGRDGVGHEGERS
jgi:hypothetical protein